MAELVDAVDAINPEYTEMAKDWDLIDALMGGTRAMHAGGAKWLPMETKEHPDEYRGRLERSVLFNVFRKTVSDMSDHPFSEKVTLRGGDLPEPLNLIEASADGEGRTLTDFAKRVLEIGLLRGLVHILVDYPKQPAGNLREERELALKPIFVAIDPKDLLGWRYEQAPNGKKTLTQIRIRESFVKETGDYAVENKERIRVITRDSWELHEKGSDGKYTVTESGPWTVGKVTLATIYFRQTGFMTGRSPLQHLAELNLMHYRQLSDYLNTLRFAGTGMFFASGLSTGDMEKPIVMGVTHAFKTTSTEAKIEIVEHSGAALGAVRDALLDTEMRMRYHSNQPLAMHGWSSETAMGRAIDEGRSRCDLESWVRNEEGGILQAFRFASDWTKKPLPDDFAVDIFDDFAMSFRADRDLDFLLRLALAGKITDETLLREFKQRAVLSPTVKVDEEIDGVRRQGPSPGTIGREREE